MQSIDSCRFKSAAKRGSWCFSRGLWPKPSCGPGQYRCKEGCSTLDPGCTFFPLVTKSRKHTILSFHFVASSALFSSRCMAGISLGNYRECQVCSTL